MVRWRGGYCGYFLPTESLRDSKCQLRTVTWPIHRCKCRRNHRGIQNSSSVRWRAMFTVRLADGITDGIWPSAKVNISTRCRSSPPLFLLLLPHLNSPQLQTTSPPKKISLFSAQQVIFLEVFSSQHPYSDLPTDFYQFL